MTADATISDNILEQAQDAINAALQTPNLPPDRRAVLEVQNYFLMFLRNDHKKITEVYADYLANKQKRAREAEDEKWTRRTIYGTALAALVMLFINGFIFWISTTPLIQAILESAIP